MNPVTSERERRLWRRSETCLLPKRPDFDHGPAPASEGKGGKSKGEKGLKVDWGPVARGALVAGPAEQGSFGASASSPFASSLSMEGSEVVFGAGTTAGLACFAWLQNRNGLLKTAGYEAAAPYPTLDAAEWKL